MAIQFAAMRATAAKAFNRKTTANIAKRLNRRAATNAVGPEVVEEFARVRALPATTRNEAVAKAKQLDRLNQDQSLRGPISTANVGKSPRALAKIRNDQIVERAKDIGTRMRMTEAELESAARALAHRTKMAAYRTKKQYGESHATRILDKTVQDYKDVFSNKNGSSTNRRRLRLLGYVRDLVKVSEYEGITPAGARKQEARGVELFGPGYANLTTDEKTAVWNEVHSKDPNEMYDYKDKIEEWRIALSANKKNQLTYGFQKDQHGNLKASMTNVGRDVVKKAIKNTAQEALKARMMKGKNPLAITSF